jgi:hypothetical protein
MAEDNAYHEDKSCAVPLYNIGIAETRCITVLLLLLRLCHEACEPLPSHVLNTDG